MDDADQPGLPARLDAHARPGNGRRCRDAAEEGNDHVSDALGDQLLVGLQTDPGHVGADGSTQQGLHGSQRGDGENRRDKIGQVRPGDIGQAQARIQQQGLRDSTDHRSRSGQEPVQKRRQDDAQQG